MRGYQISQAVNEGIPYFTVCVGEGDKIFYFMMGVRLADTFLFQAGFTH